MSRNKYKRKFLNDIVENNKNAGFSLDMIDRVEDLALLSMKVGLRSYFSTYKTLKYEINNYDRSNPNNTNNYSADYYEIYSETISHFQHFFELTLKKYLYQSTKNIVSFGCNINDLFRGLENNKCGILNNELEILLEDKNKDVIKTLYELRNKIMHSGNYILHYKNFDKFIGKYVLPIIDMLIHNYDIKKYEKYWYYDFIDCKINPISEIVDEFKKINIDYKKIAWLQEIGRAAYNNPLNYNNMDFLTEHIIKRANFTAGGIATGKTFEHVSPCIEKCPVCGKSTLVTNLDDNLEMVSESVSSIECMCCGLEVYIDLGNPKEHGLDLGDFFTY